MSAGRAGAPGLSFAYSSNGGNTEFGYGWSVGLPSISRKTDKGLPRYYDQVESDVFILAGSEDLVPVLADDAQWGGAWGETGWGDGAGVGGRWVVERDGYRIYRYRPRVEAGHALIERFEHLSTGEVHWRTISSSNVKSYFGRNSASRIQDPDDASRVFEWLLDKVEDDRGNIVVYEYKAEDDVNVDTNLSYEENRGPTTAQRYIKRIKYGNSSPGVESGWTFQAVFDYGEHGTDHSGELEVSPTEDTTWPVRQDCFSTFRPGFEVRTRRLCRRVLMFHDFSELSASPYLVAATVLTHDETGAASRVTSIEHVAYELNGGTGYFTPATYPAVDLTYTEAAPENVVRMLDPESLENLPAGVDGSRFRFVDLDGEGLPGVLAEDSGRWFYKPNRGGGTFGPMAALAEQPSSASLAGGAQQLVDLDGAGAKHLVTYGRPSPGFYERTEQAGWGAFRRFGAVPNIDWRDPNLQFVDLDGDGYPDVFLLKQDHFLWYRSKGKEGFEGPWRVARPKDERSGPVLVFAEQEKSIFLADMSGDGLTDLVRVRNGSVVYWPNLGNGRFGRQISLASAPTLDRADRFDATRVRLSDVDGTGPADLIYLGVDGARLWRNLSGNALDSSPTEFPSFPPLDTVSNVDVVDLLGNGTACLVWSSPRPRGGTQIRYIDLMGGKKPHLLEQVDNNRGVVSKVQYAASTKFYVQDVLAGRPWVTRLPFPVQVVERVEAHDLVTRQKAVQFFAYHHGHFDGPEREFRGFGMVETWDTESFEDFTGSGLFSFQHVTVEEDLHQPPVHTKTWFHTGAFRDGKRISTGLKAEYWDGDSQGESLPDSTWTDDMSPQEMREAVRALAGSTLRSEVYALDGSADEDKPYSVAEGNFHVERLQPISGQRHAVFRVQPRESVTFHYERNPNDPRVAHSVVLDVDSYGNVVQKADLVYPRRGTPAHTEQTKLYATVGEAELAALPEQEDDYRHSVPVESRAYELHGLSAQTTLYSFAEVEAAVDAATAIDREADPSGYTYAKRLLKRSRTRYYEDDLSGPLAYGETGLRAIPYDSDTAALTNAQLNDVLGGLTYHAPNATTMTDAGYVLADGLWWLRSGRSVPDASKFYQVTQMIDPFGQSYSVTYDSHHFLTTQSQDPLGNTVAVANDYRVLAPWQVTDPNGNRTQVEFDTRGMVVKTAVMGKSGDSDGDTLSDPTTTFEYELFRWRDETKPNYAKQRVRVEHGNSSTEWIESYSYVSGSGAVIMTKSQAEPGLAPERDTNGDLVLVGGELNPVDTSPDLRWVGNGRTVFDNKGNPVKQYEPYFSSIAEFEDEAELVEHGVTPVLHYDPLGRLIKTDLPNGTWSEVDFDPWQHTTQDPNDTAYDAGGSGHSSWYSDRIGYSGTDPGELAEKAAASSVEDHADTPATVHLDTLGRPFLAIAHNGLDAFDQPILFETKTIYDIEGNALEVVDARDNTAEERTYGMLGQVLRTESVDAGDRWSLMNVLGDPLRLWDSRDNVFRLTYDDLNRVVDRLVSESGGTEKLLERTVYGETLPVQTPPEDTNHRLRVFRTYDGGGEATVPSYDFKGNPESQERKLLSSKTTRVDWVGMLNEATVAGMATAASSLLESTTYTTSTTYDALNRPVTATSPDSTEVTYAYNESGLLETVDAKHRGSTTTTNVVTGLKYDAKGRREEIEYGSGTKTTYAYDPLTFRVSRIRTTRTSDSAVLQSLHYHYDPVGNITKVRDTAQQTVYFQNTVVSSDQDFIYDPLYRLTEAQGREHSTQGTGQRDHDQLVVTAQPDTADPAAMRRYTQEFTYDEVGNILKMVHAPAVGTGWTRYYDYATTGNRLQSTSAPGDPAQGPYSDSYSYDAHGNMTAMPHASALAWDVDDQMLRADVGTESTYFQYAGGSRIRKYCEKSGTTTEERIYLGAFELYRKRVSGSVDVERESLHISDDTGRICLVETKTVDSGTPVSSPTGVWRYQLSNHLGTSATELDSSGAVISYEEYHPYGTSSYRAADSSFDVSSKRYRYTGKERDDETGLYYHGARYYAPWLGRWTAADPIGLGDGVNRFAYSRNNPIRLSDPSGRFAQGPTVIQDDAPVHSPGDVDYEGHWEGSSTPDGKQWEYVPGEGGGGNAKPRGRRKARSWNATRNDDATAAVDLDPGAAPDRAPPADPEVVAERAERDRDLARLNEVQPPGELGEWLPDSTQEFERDQSAGIQDDFLRFKARFDQAELRRTAIISGRLKYSVVFLSGAIEGGGDISVAANVMREARALARARAPLTRPLTPTGTEKSAPPRALLTRPPITIPRRVKPATQVKGGYFQVRYRWRSAEGVRVEARFHGPTPGAPEGAPANWRVSRTFPGSPDGSVAKKTEHLVQWPNGDWEWVSSTEWWAAQAAFKAGTATLRQKALLRAGHL